MNSAGLGEDWLRRLCMGSIEVWKKAYRAVVQACPPLLNNIYLATQRLEQLLKRTQLMERWARWEYHVCPWILADYSSKMLDLSDPSSDRDLSKNKYKRKLANLSKRTKKKEDENRMIKEALLMINPNLQNLLFKAPIHATSSHNNKDIDSDESDDINSSSYNDDDNNYDDEDDTQDGDFGLS